MGIIHIGISMECLDSIAPRFFEVRVRTILRCMQSYFDVVGLQREPCVPSPSRFKQRVSELKTSSHFLEVINGQTTVIQRLLMVIKFPISLRKVTMSNPDLISFPAFLTGFNGLLQQRDGFERFPGLKTSRSETTETLSDNIAFRGQGAA